MKNKYIYFYWGWVFDISYEVCGYFDNRPRINIDLIFFNLCITLPFRNKWTDECDSPKYGIAIHYGSFLLYYGGKGNMKGGRKFIAWNIPFITKKWIRTSILLKDGNWEHEILGGDKKDFYDLSWKDKQMCWVYDFIDYDGEIIPTKIYVDEREWRPKWLCWTGLFKKVIRTIDVHFSKECGREKGSYKGGTINCGYEVKAGEAIYNCITRMELEWSGDIVKTKYLNLLKFKRPKSYISV